tara:strand:+ start:1649 stop:2077 length:429 start_codon:yes stop_codon:yes gene_type:complete
MSNDDTVSSTEVQEIILENRNDLKNFLKNTKYEYVVLKFYADWCKPCKFISPYVKKIIEEKTKCFNEWGVKDKFIFVEIDVDECFDLYAFLKKQKRINGIPAIFLYSKKIYMKLEEGQIHIPQGSISGTNEEKIRKLLDFIK